MTDKVFSISLSKDGRFLLCNVSFEQPRIEMYDLNRKEVVQKFKGHKQQIYLIKCDFGGVNESFVVAGSEDAFIYLWNKEKGDHIAKIGGEKGHTQVVNQISWNPTDSFLFASASDD